MVRERSGVNLGKRHGIPAVYKATLRDTMNGRAKPRGGRERIGSLSDTSRIVQAGGAWGEGAGYADNLFLRKSL